MGIQQIYGGMGREDKGLEHLQTVKAIVEEDPDSVEKGCYINAWHTDIYI